MRFENAAGQSRDSAIAGAIQTGQLQIQLIVEIKSPGHTERRDQKQFPNAKVNSARKECAFPAAASISRPRWRCVFARLILGELEDKGFQIRPRQGNFDVSVVRAVEQKRDLVV